MNSIEQAIRKAIEGGWKGLYPVSPHVPPPGTEWNKPRCGDCFCGIQDLHSHYQNDDRAFLDPEFWRCVGKAMGWNYNHVCIIDGDPMLNRGDCGNERHTVETYEWSYYWHRFIDHLAEGKDAESFFSELLKEKV